MKQRLLGQQKAAVSALGLGCMGMSEFYGAGDEGESLRTLARAVDLGVTFFDTADTYGHGRNELLLGKFLAQIDSSARAKLVIATKFGIVREEGKYERRIDNSAAYVRSACEASLRRLGVDCIDLYYCHRRNPEVPIEELIGSMAALVKVGKVRQIGLSEVSPASLRRAHAVHPIAAVQSEYSLWSREPETGMLQTCRELGTSFVAYSPLGRAFLTGTVQRDELADDDFRKHNPRFSEAAAAANGKLVAALSQFTQARHLSNAQVALAWLLGKHDDVIPIPGTRRVRYLEDNLAAVDVALGADEIAELDRLFAPEHVVGARYNTAGMLGIE